MILYFCDKKLNVYGCLSNRLPDSPIESDQLTKDIDSTVATLELTLDYTAQTRAELEQWTMPGCYILMRYDDGKDYVFQIIDAELDTGNMSIEVTAEDAGLELLNVECLIYPDEEQGDTKDPQTLTWYVSKWIKGSGFEIGVNESSSTNKKALTFDSEQTATERLKEVARKFEMEIDYSFAIDGLTIKHKYVNIHKKIGADNGVRLYAGRNLSSITVKRSIENLATCLLVYGSTPDGGLGPLTLDGYVYNDGEYYVDGHYVKSKTAVEKWGMITRTFEYDTTDQQTLLSEAIKELKTRADVEVNYEVDVVDAPENIHVGDTVGIVDDAGGLYLSARILKMERSIIDHSTKLTIGNYLIKTAGLSATVQDMSRVFQIIRSDMSGVNQAKVTAQESAKAVDDMQARMDSGEFKGEDAVTLRVDSSRGTVFKNNAVATVLTVTIYKGSEIITTAADLARVFGAKAALEWHWKGLDDTAWKIISVDDKRLSNGGFAFALSPEDVTTKVVLECVLNTED